MVVTGPATHTRDADVAASARERLDRAAAAVGTMESAQRHVLASLIELWPTSAWLAAGARSAKQWLVAYTTLSYPEAARLERIAELCARDDRLASAVVEGTLSLGRADRLTRAVTPERAPWLRDAVESFLQLNRSTADDDAFSAAVRYWVDRVDELLAPRRVQTQSLIFSERLFGGGDMYASLTPVAFETVKAAVDAFTPDPDPADAPYMRTLSERRADGLDDLAIFGLTHHPDHDDVDPDDEAARADDTFDGSHPGDALDEALLPENQDREPLDILRSRLAKAEQHRRRRARRQTRARSGVCVNVHIDLRTLAGTRDITDLDHLVLRGDGWSMARSAAQQLLCDCTLVATLFDGPTRILDANDAAEQFTKRQRRALAARDHHCVFPGCRRPARHCDTHHLHQRAAGGPTITSNGCLLCRFHHRLVHQHRWTLRHDGDDWIATDPHGVEWKARPTHQTR